MRKLYCYSEKAKVPFFINNSLFCFPGITIKTAPKHFLQLKMTISCNDELFYLYCPYIAGLLIKESLYTSLY